MITLAIQITSWQGKRRQLYLLLHINKENFRDLSRQATTKSKYILLSIKAFKATTLSPLKKINMCNIMGDVSFVCVWERES